VTGKQVEQKTRENAGMSCHASCCHAII